MSALITRAVPSRLPSDDSGELGMRVFADHDTKTVVIDFGRAVSWIGMGPEEVRTACEALLFALAELESLKVRRS